MNIGSLEIELLSEGIFEIYKNGTFQKVEAEVITGRKQEHDLPTSYSAVGIDPILIKNGKQLILLDTGLGWGLDHRSSYLHVSNLKTNLEIFGLSPEDITHVILSHLHYDHAAGSTYVDEHAHTQLTLPNAHYYVQKIEWHYAIEQAENTNTYYGEYYLMDELYKLYAAEKLVLLTEQHIELLPGIHLIRTGGHTPGHQIVKLQSNGETGYYLGDLVPNETHLNHYFSKIDQNPIQTKKAKTLILQQALKEHAHLIFYHSISAKAGRLKLDTNNQYTLSETEGHFSI